MDVEKELIQDRGKNISIVISSYFLKMRGERKSRGNVKISEGVIAATGGLVAIIIISLIAVFLGYPIVLGPMGASSLLVFAAHKLPFSQPRQILGGHIISTVTALLVWDIYGKSHVTIGITLALVLFLMIFLKVVHPPAAASAMVAINSQAGWGFLFAIFITSLLLIMVSLFYNNLFRGRQYPKHWL